MPRSPIARQLTRRMIGRSALAGLAVGLGLTSQVGCGREFFRHWADQDVSEAIFEKSRDPHWRMDKFTMEPPAMARFANPYDVDRQPAPPDDPAAQALSPTPQLPYHRLMVPAEGTGYLTMLSGGPRYDSPPPQATPPAVVPAPDSRNNPPPPDPGVPNPFNPTGNSGTSPPGATLTKGSAKPIAMAAPPAASRATPPQARTRPKDPGVLLSSYQAPGSTATTPTGAALPTIGPGQDVPGSLPPLPGMPAQDPTQPQRPAAERLTSPAAALDPNIRIDPNSISGPRPPAPANSNEFLEKLNPIIVLDEARASSYPRNSKPFLVGPAEALQLALMNSRTYQFRLENIYQIGLQVTLARFGFQPQLYAGFSPLTAPTSFIPNNPGNNFIYNTKETGAQRSVLTMGNAVGVGKALNFGGQIAAGFANTLVFNFLGSRPQQPTVTSFLPLTFSQRFLAGGGRAVALEPLTQAERNLLYEVRGFARLRQSVVPTFLTSQQNLDGAAGTAADLSPGYLNILQLIQNVENDLNTLVSYEQLFELYRNYVGGGASSGIAQIQVDQIASQIQSTRGILLGDEATYKTNLDSYKVALGLPPDVPLLLDRSPVRSFNTVFKNLVLWARRGGDPEELNGIILGLPKLETIVVDGRPLFRYGITPTTKNLLEPVFADPDKQQELLLAAERIALENRLDLMNQRAILYDAWRQLSFTANGLKGVFNVQLSNQITTAPGNTNPLAFIDQAKAFQVSINSELPLVRVVQRNNYRQATINYNRQQRVLQDSEDAVKQQVRTEIYNLISLAENYEIGKVNLLLTIRQRDFSVRQIISPPDASQAGANSANQAAQTINLINGINNILGIQRNLLGNWVNFQTQRLALYRDLGLIPYDEWEAYYEFFPANSISGNAAPAGGNGPAVVRPADAPAAGRP